MESIAGSVTSRLTRRRGGDGSVSLSDVTNRDVRVATLEELHALSHPVRWRILRLCLDAAYTNQQLADRLGLAPATVLRHIRSLVEVGFLRAEPVRTGAHGALERPYRATGSTWGLQIAVGEVPELAQQVDLALIAAHRAEILDAGPGAERATSRGVMRLGPESLAELRVRIGALLDEFADRDDPDGEPLSYLWSVVGRPTRE
jgi:DNA-binding transcriptional ArsR family regulator